MKHRYGFSLDSLGATRCQTPGRSLSTDALQPQQAAPCVVHNTRYE